MDAGCRETHLRRRHTTGALAKAAWGRPASTSPRLQAAPGAVAALCLAQRSASCSRWHAACRPAGLSTQVRQKDASAAPCGGQTKGIGHRRMGVGAHALRGADRRVAVCVACLGGGQMLDQAKVPGERAAEADAHVQRRVAKFFGLACANGVAKGCVNLGVMQVRCAGLGASPLACLHPRCSPLVCPWHVAWRAQASDALWQG